MFEEEDAPVLLRMLEKPGNGLEVQSRTGGDIRYRMLIHSCEKTLVRLNRKSGRCMEKVASFLPRKKNDCQKAPKEDGIRLRTSVQIENPFLLPGEAGLMVCSLGQHQTAALFPAAVVSNI